MNGAWQDRPLGGRLRPVHPPLCSATAEWSRGSLETTRGKVPKVTEVLVELEGDRLAVRFPVAWSGGEPTRETAQLLDAIRSVAGRRFANSTWTVPKDWQSAVELRRAFGANLRLGPKAKRWGRAE